MCGFLGEITPHLLEKSSFKKLLDLSKHRGPDQQSIWREDHCQLGFNRLAILDVSQNAMQPLLSPSGRYALVFNGEIYNYKVLQKKYNIEMSDLRSASDSEILAHLVERVSIEDFANVLNGMFAIAIWDIQKKKLYLIRDFSGIKPLFYGLSDLGIVFASQFDQLFKHPLCSEKTLRPEIMKEFFGLGYMSPPNTVFKDIFQLEPGQFLVWDYEQKCIEKKVHFFDWRVAPSVLDSLNTTREDFSACMEKVVKQQLQSDVPLATFLSSGYDSSLVTAYAKKHKEDLKAFTFGIKDSVFDESQDAKSYAAHLKVSHVIAQAESKMLLEVIDSHFKMMSEPFGDYSSIPAFLTTKEAKKHATVMLSGDGGDELFWGYPRFRKSLNQAHWFNYPLWFRKIIIPFARKKNKKLSSALTLINKFSDWILQKQIHFTGLNNLMPQYDFSKDLYALYTYENKLNRPNILQYLKKNEFFGHMQRTLRKVDLTSMANSLEVRVPFLDKQLINFSNTVIPEFTITHDRPKLILKDDLYQFIPIEKVAKQKKGFTVPVADWLNNAIKQDFIDTVIGKPFFGAAYIDEEFLKSQVEAFYKNSRNIDPWGLWHLYAWQKWAINNELV